jgi:hypothetical protein
MEFGVAVSGKIDSIAGLDFRLVGGTKNPSARHKLLRFVGVNRAGFHRASSTRRLRTAFTNRSGYSHSKVAFERFRPRLTIKSTI